MIDYNEKTRELLNASSHRMLSETEDYIFSVDKDMVYRAASDSIVRMAGLSSIEDIIGKTDYDIFPRELAEKYRQDDMNVMETGKPMEGVIERIPGPDGKPRWTKTWKSAVYGKNGELLGLYGYSRDVTRMLNLEAAEKLARRYSSLISDMPGGIGIFHREGEELILDFANGGWARAHHMEEMPPEELTGLPLLSNVYERDKEALLTEFAAVDEQKKTQGSVDYRVYGIDGKLHWICVLFRYAYEMDDARYYYASYTDIDDQKRAEEELKDSQRALREAVDNSEIQFFTYFPGKNRCEIYAVNSRLAQLPMVWENFPDDFLEYTRATDEDAEKYREMLRRIDEGEDEAACIVRFIYNGVYNWEKLVIRAVRDEKGATVKAQGYSINVNDKVSEEKHFKTEQLRGKTLEGNIFEAFSLDITSNSGIDMQTKDRVMLEQEVTEQVVEEAVAVCPSLARSNIAARDVLLKAAMRIPDAEERASFIRSCSREGIRELLNTGSQRTSMRYRRYVGESICWVRSSLEILPDPDTGNVIAFFHTADINDEVIDEMLAKRIMGMNYETVAYCDLQSGRLFINSAKNSSDRMLDGMPYEEALEHGCAQTDENQQAEIREKFGLDNIVSELENTQVYTIYYSRRETRRDMSGNPHVQMKNDIFYLDEHKEILVFLLTDITEIIENDRENREQISSALIAARQASEAKSNFLASMSHEIRTPLNAIIGMDTIAAQSIGNTDKVADCISKIGLSARYLLSLINDILDMSRIESGKMLLKNESFVFAEFISGVNNIIYPQVKAKGLDYECTVSSEVEELYVGDEMKLQQILVNVLGNAVKFTERGRISLDISVISMEKDITKLRFVVNDTGCGIPEENMQFIFDAFEQVDTSTTTVFGGTGLGLAITKNLAGLMGGRIGVRSIVDIGSEFTIDIPLTVDKSISRQTPIMLNLKDMHTLIVDDDLLICEQTDNILRDIGMIGEWVTTGREAIERVRGKSASGVYYDFILIDWKMPDMDGIETTRSIRKIVGPDVTIIIISAYDWQSIEAEARAAGANLMISKPLLKSTLVSAFEKAMGTVQEEEESAREFDFTGRRVLLVEDNELNAEIARTLLESRNFIVEAAGNGIKALEKFAGNPAGYYDIILMDVRMPMMDGLQATVNIRHWDKADARTVPIVAMTANAFDEDVEKSRAAGMNAHLSKPIDPDIMYATLHRLLEKDAQN